MSEWISVDDRLPISKHEMESNYETKSILVYMEDGVFSAEYRCGKTIGFWHEFNIDGYVKTVTHWMPLPEPPKGE